MCTMMCTCAERMYRVQGTGYRCTCAECRAHVHPLACAQVRMPLTLERAIRHKRTDTAQLSCSLATFTALLVVDNPHRWFSMAVHTPSVFELLTYLLAYLLTYSWLATYLLIGAHALRLRAPYLLACLLTYLLTYS